MRPRACRLTALLLLGNTACVLAGPPAAFGPPERLAEVVDARLDEVSGIAASRRHPGHFYVHNDSGDRPRVFVLDEHGHVAAELRLAGARAVDWEDIAMRPPAGEGRPWRVVVADIGDNKARRPSVQLYWFDEPAELSVTATEVAAESLELRYPDGPTNAEGLAIDPQTGDAYIFAKDERKPRVYRLSAPWPSDGPATPTLLTDLTLPGAVLPPDRLITAADFSPDGSQIAVRTYVNGWIWTRSSPSDDGAAPRDWVRILAQPPQRLVLAAEPQGEALAFSPDGQRLLTISEKQPTALNAVARELSAVDRGTR